MAQINVDFYNHRGSWKISDVIKQQIKDVINQAGEEIKSADVYFMRHSTTQYATARKDQLKIFFGATPGDAKVENYFLTTDKNTYAVESILVKTIDYAMPINSSHGQVIGFYSEKYNEFYVPFVIDELDEEIVNDIVTYVMKQFKENVLDEFINVNSWVRSKQKDALKSRVEAHLSQGKEYRVRELKAQITDTERAIEQRRHQLKERYDALVRYRNEVEIVETMGVTGLDNFVKGLDLIAEHPQVSNILVKDDLITIYIDNVHAYANVKGQDRRYYIGNMHVKININNTDIRFFGDNGRQSVWTSHDPHPHVNGGDGRACLGNVSATIAELCSQKEIYPLFLVCLDFLENANTEDAAGKKITRWDEVDENGIMIDKSSEVVACCQRCDDEVDEDNVYTVFTDFDSGDGQLLGAEHWCEDCRDNYASYADGFEELVCDEIYNDVEDYRADDEEEGEDLF